MSETIASQRSQYPLAAYNFRVTVGEKTMGFASVSGLLREYQTLAYRHGLSFAEGEAITKFRVDQYSELTLEKGVVAGAKELYQWLDSLDKQPLSVDLCDEQGNAVVTWTIQQAIVSKLEAPALKADAGEAAIETITLMASGISVGHQ